MRFVAALSSERALRFVAAHLFFFPLHRDAREQAHSPALGEALSERALRFVAALPPNISRVLPEQPYPLRKLRFLLGA